MSLEEFLDVFEYNDKCYINVYKKDVEDKEYHKKVSNIPPDEIKWYFRTKFLKDFQVIKYNITSEYDVDINNYNIIMNIYVKEDIYDRKTLINDNLYETVLGM